MLKNKGGKLLRDRTGQTWSGQAQDTPAAGRLQLQEGCSWGKENPKITVLQIRNWMLNVGAAADGGCVYILTVELYSL